MRWGEGEQSQPDNGELKKGTAGGMESGIAFAQCTGKSSLRKLTKKKNTEIERKERDRKELPLGER